LHLDLTGNIPNALNRQGSYNKHFPEIQRGSSFSSLEPSGNSFSSTSSPSSITWKPFQIPMTPLSPAPRSTRSKSNSQEQLHKSKSSELNKIAPNADVDIASPPQKKSGLEHVNQSISESLNNKNTLYDNSSYSINSNTKGSPVATSNLKNNGHVNNSAVSSSHSCNSSTVNHNNNSNGISTSITLFPLNAPDNGPTLVGSDNMTVQPSAPCPTLVRSFPSSSSIASLNASSAFATGPVPGSSSDDSMYLYIKLIPEKKNCPSDPIEAYVTGILKIGRIPFDGSLPPNDPYWIGLPSKVVKKMLIQINLISLIFLEFVF